MKQKQLLGAMGVGLISLGLTTNAGAALVGRLPATLGGTDYQAVYDDVQNITWLASANLAATNTFGVAGISIGGSMTWSTANSWITAMNADGGTGYLGFNDWRLPTTLLPDSTCSNTNSSGFNCTGSEMGHLYNVDGITLATPDLFTDIQSNRYWTGTEFTPDPSAEWDFDFSNGNQLANFKVSNDFAWAVRPGDVSTVPIPAAVWLFGSGLLGLAGVARRKA